MADNDFITRKDAHNRVNATATSDTNFVTKSYLTGTLGNYIDESAITTTDANHFVKDKEVVKSSFITAPAPTVSKTINITITSTNYMGGPTVYISDAVDHKFGWSTGVSKSGTTITASVSIKEYSSGTTYIGVSSTYNGVTLYGGPVAITSDSITINCNVEKAYLQYPQFFGQSK